MVLARKAIFWVKRTGGHQDINQQLLVYRSKEVYTVLYRIIPSLDFLVSSVDENADMKKKL